MNNRGSAVCDQTERLNMAQEKRFVYLAGIQQFEKEIENETLFVAHREPVKGERGEK